MGRLFVGGKTTNLCKSLIIIIIVNEKAMRISLIIVPFISGLKSITTTYSFTL